MLRTSLRCRMNSQRYDFLKEAPTFTAELCKSVLSNLHLYCLWCLQEGLKFLLFPRGWNFSCSRGIHLNSDRLACIWNQVWSVVITHESKSSMWHIKSSSSNKRKRFGDTTAILRHKWCLIAHLSLPDLSWTYLSYNYFLYMFPSTSCPLFAARFQYMHVNNNRFHLA
jgi:hypothetical protein